MQRSNGRRSNSAYVATALLGMAVGRPMLRHLGATGLPITHIENASASGSTAFRQACIEVASGDQRRGAGGRCRQAQSGAAREHRHRQSRRGRDRAVHALLAADQRYAHRHGVSFEDIARVAVKNHRNGAKNRNAQRQKERTLDEVLGGKKSPASLTALQCTPWAKAPPR